MFSIIAKQASMFSFSPPLPKLSKKPGPTCKPIIKTNRIRPKSCRNVSVGVGPVKPMCPAKIPTKRMKVTPREIHLSLFYQDRLPAR